ncbi:MAG TPA: non-canonical purine NTP pyrophosphatase [Candidatus Saccharimonadales bacterium]
MTDHIVFATSNTGKVKTLEGHLKIHGIDISVSQQELDLIEPQAETALEVARVKAEQAFDKLRQPVLVDDSSFHIHALNGFPGPYVKYMNETVGAGGIVRFMEKQTDRKAHFLSALVFIDKKGEVHEFSVQESTGTIATEVRESVDGRGWSDLWKIFIPAGSDKALSQMTPEDHEQRRRRESGKSAYDLFAEWLKNN